MTDLPSGFCIRPAEAADHAALRMVCLRTGDSGADSTGQQDDPDLLGLVYAVPYQVFAPDFAFVLEDGQGVCGYVLAVPDSAAFADWMDRVWFPPLRVSLRNPGPDPARWTQSDWVRWRVFAPRTEAPVDLARFPAHLHIDLLERAQGMGLGRAMIDQECRRLAQAGCPGVFLEVSHRNLRAQAFYRHLGFQVEVTTPDALVMVRTLTG